MLGDVFESGGRSETTAAHEPSGDYDHRARAAGVAVHQHPFAGAGGLIEELQRVGEIPGPIAGTVATSPRFQ